MSSKNLTRLARQLSSKTGWSHARSVRTLKDHQSLLPPSSDEKSTEEFLQKLASGTLLKLSAPNSVRQLNFFADFDFWILARGEYSIPPADKALFAKAQTQLTSLVSKGYDFKSLAEEIATNGVGFNRTLNAWTLRLPFDDIAGPLPTLTLSQELLPIVAFTRSCNQQFRYEDSMKTEVYLRSFTKSKTKTTYGGPGLTEVLSDDAISPQSPLHLPKFCADLALVPESVELYAYICYRLSTFLPSGTTPAGELADIVMDYFNPKPQPHQHQGSALTKRELTFYKIFFDNDLVSSILAKLHTVVKPPATTLWLNTPAPALGATPLDTLLAGNIKAVQDLLDGYSDSSYI